MSGESGPTETEPDYEHWPIDGTSEATYVGMIDSGRHAVYDETTNTVREAETDTRNNHLRLTDDSHDIHPTETVGEALERLGDEIGWQSLSKFARTHMEDTDE